MTQVLNVRDLCVTLDSGETVIEEVELCLDEGEIIGLVGESGCGKTTTALALLGFARPGVQIEQGQVTIRDEQLLGQPAQLVRRARGRLVSYVPQDAAVSLNPSIRIGRQIAAILRARGQASSTVEVQQALGRVHLPPDAEFARRFPHQLSGGQQQRVALAIAFAGEPAVVVLDEPTTGLDVITQERILEEIRRLRTSTRTAMIYVSHDLAAVGSLADRIAVMYGGRIVEIGRTGDILRRPQHPYTLGLISSIPDRRAGRQLQSIGGVAVAPDERPQGCAFAPRCFLAQERCATEWPAPERPDAGERVVRCFEWRRTPPLKRRSEDRGAEATEASDIVLRVEGLSASHATRRGDVVAVNDVSFAVRSGMTLALVGESGSGKTTIARCIAGLHVPSGGSIQWCDKEVAGRARDRTRVVRREIQIVFQNPYESLNPRRTLASQIARPARQLRGLDRAEAKREVSSLLEWVRLPARSAARYPAELSGGERQRAAIARGLAAGPKLLICDEITSSLDVSVQAAVLELLRELRNGLGLSLLFIAHDIGVVAAIADSALVLETGCVREYRPIRELLDQPQAAYTQSLLAAAPVLPPPAEPVLHQEH